MQAGLANRRLTFREVLVCMLTLLVVNVTMAFGRSRGQAADTNVQVPLAA